MWAVDFTFLTIGQEEIEMSGIEIMKRLIALAEVCNDQNFVAKLVTDAWIRGDINYDQACNVCNIAGIANPLEYWQ